MKHLIKIENFKLNEKFNKTYEEISMAPKKMDQDLYFFLKKFLKNTKFEIVYTVGYDKDNVEDISFVPDDGIDDDDKYVAIRNRSDETMVDYYANEFNANTIKKDTNFTDKEIEEIEDSDIKKSYVELKNILNTALKEYKLFKKYNKYNL